MSDLSSVTLIHKSQHNARIPAWLGRAAQANFLQALETVHPELSRAIYDAPGAKPFTSSTLIGARKEGEMILLGQANTLHLRYTTLHPQLTAIFHQGILPGFMVKVTYHLTDDVGQRRYLQALAGFVKYSGVGVITTVGIGQVRAI